MCFVINIVLLFFYRFVVFVCLYDVILINNVDRTMRVAPDVVPAMFLVG